MAWSSASPGNHAALAGASATGGTFKGTADQVRGNNILVVGDNSIAINQLAGTTGTISDNLIRLDALNATGILVPDFVVAGTPMGGFI